MANHLRRLREDRGLTQRELAQRITELSAGRVEPDANQVSRWERTSVTPGLRYRSLLAKALDVRVSDLGFTSQPAAIPNPRRHYVEEHLGDVDPRVARDQDEWRRTRHALNANRAALARLAAHVYDPSVRVSDTGLIAGPGWIPDQPVDIAAVKLDLDERAPEPEIHGTEPETAHVRPLMDLVRPFPRYTHAIRDLAHPRLWENRCSWRLTDLNWHGDHGRMTFGPTTYFETVDICEAVAHETAYVAIDGNGQLRPAVPTMRELPMRRLIGDPFDFARRSLLPATPTLTVRRDGGDASFVLHERSSRNVAIAGGLLHVIPSGMFQPSSIQPAAQRADFDLWRNIMREASEELLGNPEHDGDGSPIDYDADEPFRTMEQARRDGRIRVHCLGVALDALTLVGEILTVAVFDADVFDQLAGDFVALNDEGAVVAERVPFTEDALRDLLDSGRMAPAGAGCLELAWRHRGLLLGE